MRAPATAVFLLGCACAFAQEAPPSAAPAAATDAADPSASPAPGATTGATLVPAPGSGNTQVIETLLSGGIGIEANNPYVVVPTLGFLPLFVTIRNNTAETHEWRMTTRASTNEYAVANYVGEFGATVPPRTTRVFKISAPLPDFGSSSYRRVTLRVTGPGVAQPEVSWSTSSYAVPSSPSSSQFVLAGLSPAIFKAHEPQLLNYHQRIGGFAYQHCALDPALLSPDWRDYLGFSALVYTGADWRTAPPAARTAILQWVAVGGDLRIVTDEESLLALPPRAGYRYGAGTIFLYRPTDAAGYDFTVRRTTASRALFNFIYRIPPEGPFQQITTEPETPRFAAEAPKLKQEYFWVVLTIVGFGVLVGPVNLFVFCNGPRRPRLLWITPLLSLAASAVMVAFILLADGIGGRGIYFRITQLMPDGKFAVESQINASLTGLLFGREFQFQEPAWMLAVTSASSERIASGTFYMDGARYWGDWMASRREQSEMVQSVMPSRAAVRLVPAPPGSPVDAPPSLRSEYDGWLEEVYYFDAAWRPWKTARLGHGETVRLEPASFEDVSAAWAAHKHGAPATFTDYLTRLTPPRGSFFARGTGEESPLTPNLGAMRWKSFRHVVVGPVVE